MGTGLFVINNVYVKLVRLLTAMDNIIPTYFIAFKQPQQKEKKEEKRAPQFFCTSGYCFCSNLDKTNTCLHKTVY